MGLEQVDVKEIVDRAVDNKLDIPEFQREFVWDAQKVRFLAESLYRQYPVGSFLFWDSSDYTETKGAHGAGSPTWIVDGQQRTTALCLLLGRKPHLVARGQRLEQGTRKVRCPGQSAPR